jgi:hypothetical protein
MPFYEGLWKQCIDIHTCYVYFSSMAFKKIIFISWYLHQWGLAWVIEHWCNFELFSFHLHIYRFVAHLCIERIFNVDLSRFLKMYMEKLTKHREVLLRLLNFCKLWTYNKLSFSPAQAFIQLLIKIPIIIILMCAVVYFWHFISYVVV